MIRFLTLTAAALLAAGAANAQTANDDDSFTVKIRYGDLDLGTSAGQATFRGRIRAAATEACGVMPVASISEIEAVKACRLYVYRSAQAKVELARAELESSVAGTR